MKKKHPQVIAIDKWFQSEEGKFCLAGVASGVYLENRLRAAFDAGWTAKEKENTHAATRSVSVPD